jgi:hypothetical protein
LLCFFYLTGITLAQQNPISWVVDKTVGQIADELKNAGTDLINRAGIKGNALLSQAGNQANVAAPLIHVIVVRVVLDLSGGMSCRLIFPLC